MFFGEAEEYIAYRKVGDHATNMPSAERYGEIRNGNFVMSDNLKYKYDESGNITEIYENGALAAKYTYDKLSRIIREDNKKLGKTNLYTYDNNGNILSKRELGFTLKDDVQLEELSSEDICYAYNGDKLMSYGREVFEYDILGNPTLYRGKSCKWAMGRQLAEYNGIALAYNGQGRRTAKGDLTFIYDGSGNLLKQSDGLEFIYDNGGVAGVKYDNNTYIYRRNVQGDITALLDKNGVVVVKYVYDAWGNHAVLDSDGNDVNELTHIGNLNPFRYRGYYYDSETGLYFLKTRYYDPEVGRFITIDDLQYLDPESINGLNLYAYCANNPVMAVDHEGTWSWKKFWRTLGTLAVAAVIAVAAIALCVVTVGTAAPVLIGAGVGFVLGVGMSAASQAITTGHVDIGKMFLDGIMGAISGAVAVTGIGVVGSMIVGGAIGGATSIAEDIIDGKSINAGKFFLSVGIGMIGGLVSGSGADAKTLMGKDKYFKAVLETAVSPKRIAMYTAKQVGLIKNIVIAAVRFSASMIASHGVSKGLSLAFGW